MCGTLSLLRDEEISLSYHVITSNCMILLLCSVAQLKNCFPPFLGWKALKMFQYSNTVNVSQLLNITSMLSQLFFLTPEKKYINLLTTGQTNRADIGLLIITIFALFNVPAHIYSLQ